MKYFKKWRAVDVASERSLFRKMQTVVEVAKSVKVSSLDELCQEIGGLGPTMFNTSRYVPERDAFVADISSESIRRAVAFCRLLELLSEEGTLTVHGRDAARKSRFSAVLGEQAQLMLGRAGVKVGKMNSVIRGSLQADPPVLPTADVLWDELQPDMNRGTFAKLLTLLIHCERGRSSQRKIYLGFS
jgi:hypothetical protein